MRLVLDGKHVLLVGILSGFLMGCTPDQLHDIRWVVKNKGKFTHTMKKFGHKISKEYHHHFKHHHYYKK